MQPPKTGISYFGNRNPRHFAVDLKEIVSHHCNFVLHTFSENDQQFYKESVAEMIALTKAAGLECHLDPWGVGRVFGGECYSRFALHNIETCQILPDGQMAPAVCLNHPRFLEFMYKWIDDACEIGAEALFWDEPHFYIDLKDRSRFPIWFCCCTTCASLFKKEYGLAIAEAEAESIIRFKEDSVVDFLEKLCVYAQSKALRNTVCLLPFKDDRIGISNWSRVAAIAELQTLGTDPYWMFFKKDVNAFVGDFSREVAALCDQFGKEAQIWLQAYKIEKGKEEELRQAAAVAYAAGIRNFAAWSYYGNAYMSYNRSDDPQRVWDVLGEIYADLHRGDLER